MIALSAQLALLVEALCYTALGWRLAGTGWTIPAVLALCVGIALALRLTVALIPFLLVALLGLIERRSLSLSDIAAAFVKEAWAKTASFTWIQPFERWVMTRDPDPVPGAAIPILLVHGYVCNRGIWKTMRALLAARIGNPIFTISLEPPLARIDEYVGQLDARVGEICAGTSHQQVVLVCHSMGGLVARTWIARHGGDTRVAKLITLASPHHGTKLARFGVGRNVRQMKYGNEWLLKLAADECAKTVGVPVVSIYTENDNLVYPPESAELPGATNIKLARVGHVSLQFSPEAADLIVREIGAMDNNSVGR